MKIRFGEWNFGGKLIFISVIVAILSLFLPWADLGIFSVSGFQQDGYLFLLFFLYPIYKVLKNQKINKVIGLIFSVVVFIMSIIFFVSKNVDLFGSTVNAAGMGLYVFIISTIMLIIGVIKYSKIEEDIETESEIISDI